MSSQYSINKGTFKCHTSGQSIAVSNIRNVINRGEHLIIELKNSDHNKGIYGSEESIKEAERLLNTYLRDIQILVIYKDLQLANPMLSPKDRWREAEETFTMLDNKNIAFSY